MLYYFNHYEYENAILPDNLWLGVTVENQQYDWRIKELLEIPAAVLFVSVEPMLGPVDISPYLRCEGCGYTAKDKLIQGDHHLCTNKTNTLDWVICGCESGPGARLTHWPWAIQLKEQCVDANVPFFLKQLRKTCGDLVKMPPMGGQVWDQLPEVKT